MVTLTMVVVVMMVVMVMMMVMMCLHNSHTILRYLSQKYNTPDHWYPRSDLLKRTRIDSYLDW